MKYLEEMVSEKNYVDGNILSENLTFTQKKHAAAMKRAKELLSKPEAETSNIYSSLNCGKFNEKFICFLQGIFK